MAIEIVDWGKHYENNRTKELKKMTWVPMPIRHDGAGYRQLLDHPNGAAHFGAWCALVEVAASCDTRGTLLRNGSAALTEADFARMTGIPESIWREVLPRLLTIGWINNYEPTQNPAGSCGIGPHVVAMNGMEWNGMEEKGKKEVSTPTAPTRSTASVPKADFNFESGLFLGISDERVDGWSKAYPALDVETELAKAAAWLVANPAKRKKNYMRFLVNWLSRAQEQGGDRQGAKTWKR